MSILVFSDVHANATALAAILTAAQGRWEHAVCLGDLVGYGPDPNEVTEKVREISKVTIRGNHDKAACGLTNLDEFNPIAAQAATWTRRALTTTNCQYLKALPAGPAVDHGLALVHGSVQDEDEYIFSPAQALGSLLGSPQSVTFFGHTHFQGGFSHRAAEMQVIQLHPRGGANFATLRLESGTRYLLNPGSVGQPRDGDPRAAFAIADLEQGVVEFWRVPYDIKAVQQRMQDVGAPEALVLRLEWGR